jgi:mannose-6-phosphate isomerase-like protein (cupin superfamily)
MAKTHNKTHKMRKPARRSAARARPQKSARSARKVSRARSAAAHKSKKGPRRQRFVASHLEPGAFKSGLRTYAQYRDLSIADATDGLVVAHVIKMVPPCDPAIVSKRHYHDVEFQMIYVLKGWIKGEYEGDVVTMREGSCWLQPPRIKHAVLDYSDDCELLEIVLPADFKTVELE